VAGAWKAEFYFYFYLFLFEAGKKVN
jgi:hypothetical protein